MAYGAGQGELEVGGGVSADLHLSARLGFTKAQRVPGVADGHADRSAGEEQPQRESDADGL